MSKICTRQEVSSAVLQIVQGWHFDQKIREDTAFGDDIPLEGRAKGLYFYAIKIRLEKLGYDLFNFKLEDCENARTIGDIVEAVWEDINPQSKHVM